MTAKQAWAILAVFFWVQPTFAAKSSSRVPKELVEIEARYVKAKTLSAEFTQVNESTLTKTKKLSSGVVMIKHPNKMRWDTLKPDPNLLVSDGKVFWFYTPPFEKGERGQVIERKTAEVQSKLANTLLSGAFSKAKDLKITKKTPNLFELVPLQSAGGTLKRAEIMIDPLKHLVQKITLEHEGGNRSEITLTDIELGGDLPDSTFQFFPPPGTDRISQ